MSAWAKTETLHEAWLPKEDHGPSQTPAGDETQHVPSQNPMGDEYQHVPSQNPMGDDHQHVPSQNPMGDDHQHVPSQNPMGDDHQHVPTQTPMGDETQHVQQLDDDPHMGLVVRLTKQLQQPAAHRELATRDSAAQALQEVQVTHAMKHQQPRRLACMLVKASASVQVAVAVQVTCNNSGSTVSSCIK